MKWRPPRAHEGGAGSVEKCREVAVGAFHDNVPVGVGLGLFTKLAAQRGEKVGAIAPRIDRDDIDPAA